MAMEAIWRALQGRAVSVSTNTGSFLWAALMGRTKRRRLHPAFWNESQNISLQTENPIKGTDSFHETIITMQEIQLELTLAEVNQILEALGSKPYKDVFQLVSKIQARASAQLNATPTQGDGFVKE